MILPTDAVYPILIVDDSAEDRDTYRRYLSQSRNLTFEVSEAETLGDGVKRFAESKLLCCRRVERAFNLVRFASL